MLAEEGRRMAMQVEFKVAQANAFARQVEADKAAVNAETQLADVEASACGVKARDVAELQARCEQELAVAEPLVAQAEAALNTLNKKDLGAAPCGHHFFIIINFYYQYLIIILFHFLYNHCHHVLPYYHHIDHTSSSSS